MASFEELQRTVFAAAAEGRQDAALAAIADARTSIPAGDARLTFWEACLHGTAGRPDAALAALTAGVARGCRWHPTMLDDPDLEAVATTEAFADVRAACEAWLADDAPPPAPLVIGGAADRTVVALHRAASAPERFARCWAACADVGWQVVLPHAPYPMTSDERLWLDIPAGRLGLAAIDAVPGPASADVVAGYAQGGAAALHLVLGGRIRAGGLLLLAATQRYAEVLDHHAGARADGLAVAVLAGGGERWIASTRMAADRLAAMGARVHLEVDPARGHELPQDLAERAPALLADVAG